MKRNLIVLVVATVVLLLTTASAQKQYTLFVKVKNDQVNTVKFTVHGTWPNSCIRKDPVFLINTPNANGTESTEIVYSATYDGKCEHTGITLVYDVLEYAPKSPGFYFVKVTVNGEVEDATTYYRAYPFVPRAWLPSIHTWQKEARIPYECNSLARAPKRWSPRCHRDRTA